MPTIFDNIDNELAGDLVRELSGARKADFSVGYLNLKGWGLLVEAVQQLEGEDGIYCRLLIGMTQTPSEALSKLYGAKKRPISQSEIAKLKEQAIKDYRQQLMYGAPTGADEKVLRRLQEQLKEKRVQVKLFARHPLHAKLYIAHKDRDEKLARVAYLGSSNLTFSGLKGNGELNVDVVDQDAASKLHTWFQDRWDDDWCIDLTEALQETIEESWVSGPVDPYHVYIKTAWHLSHHAAEDADTYQLPDEFEEKMLEHQKLAVKLSRQRLKSQNGVVIGDVVGLGKTLVATALAKMYCDDNKCSVLVICPPALKGIWEDHLGTYHISGIVMSLGMVKDLINLRRYRLVIIDEGHKLRNRDSSRYKHVKNYIEENESKVILLTATPFNMEFTDLTSQLMLFTEPNQDLGITPENHIKEIGGELKFQSDHPDTKISSLMAFEQSDKIDDWRELMRLFMVRRTRKHIKENYAIFDKEMDRFYLEYSEGNKFYIPERETRRMKFKLYDKDVKNDTYAQLYSDKVVSTINDLSLPRYGLQHYIKRMKYSPAHQEKIKGLNRFQNRLIGFARVNLFKRLESSGSSFIISLKKHVFRNALSIVAYKKGRMLIGHHDLNGYWKTCTSNIQAYIDKASELYNNHTINDNNSSWLPSEYFRKDFIHDLDNDMKSLTSILKQAGEWDNAQDRKLDALSKLLSKTHPTEKVLVFSEFKDTIEYIFHSLKGKITGLDLIHGGFTSGETQKIIKAFSPNSNVDLSGRGGGVTDIETRVLLATDKLSEGVNLQDAYIVVNYDLPWALVKFAQRVGRVDRIGQHSKVIYCYHALPEAGIENIIRLRKRLKERITNNDELIGSDEEFFDAKINEQLKFNFEKSIDQAYDNEDDDESDLVSYAYDIWHKATKNNKLLAQFIKNLPDMIYSTKKHDQEGIIVYCKDHKNNDIITCLNKSGQVITRSQYKILRMMACTEKEKIASRQEYHYDVLKVALEQSIKQLKVIGGQLGRKNSIRRKIYEKVRQILCDESVSKENSLLLNELCEEIYHKHVKTKVKEKITNILKNDESSEFLNIIIDLYVNKELLEEDEKEVVEQEPKIKCSLGLTQQ